MEAEGFITYIVLQPATRGRAHWSVLVPPFTAEPAAQPTRWQRAAVPVAMESRLGQTSM